MGSFQDLENGTRAISPYIIILIYCFYVICWLQTPCGPSFDSLWKGSWWHNALGESVSTDWFLTCINLFKCLFFRAQLYCGLWHRFVHLLLLPWECSRTWLWENSVFSCGKGLQKWYWREIFAGGHMDNFHEGQAELLPCWRNPFLL